MPEAEARFRAALNALHAHQSVSSSNTAAIGYCFGGAVVLEMARRGVELDAVASFHGSLGTAEPAQKGRIKARVLVANGAADPFVKAEEIQAFTQEMDSAGVNYQFINYEGAKHSFTNPDADAYGQRFGLPLAYSAEADRASWAALQTLLVQAFDE
jgi:dienelactone hydrolase